MSKDDPVAGFVHVRLVVEAAAFFRLVERPPGEHLRNLGDIFLRVASVYAEGMQFHQLAAVVFVQAAGLLGFGIARLPRTICRTGAIAAPMRGDAERD